MRAGSHSTPDAELEQRAARRAVEGSVRTEWSRPKGSRARRFFSRSGRALVILGALLIAVRAYLPVAIQNYVNQTLDRVPQYDGRIGDVDLHLWRGAYSIQSVEIVKTSGKVPVPFFQSDEVQFTIEWRALLDGKVVGEIEVDRAKMNFVSAPSAKQSQLKVDAEWLEVIKDLYPLRVDRFVFRDSEIHYRDFHSDPKVNLALTDVWIEGRDFSNTGRPAEGLSAHVDARAKAQKVAPVTLSAVLEPSASEPTFSLDLAVRELPIRELNDFFRAYASFDAEGGTVGLDAELASSAKRFKGYLKPIAKDVSIFRLKTDAGNPIRMAWEGLVSIFSEIFENQRHEQIATRIPFSGTYDDPKTNIWETIGEVLYNAFIEALKPGKESSVDIRDVK